MSLAVPVFHGYARRMARRSFSFMLAWRYLNPRRAMLSAVTLISVTGVLLGVWILIVVMSVFNGLESEVKERLLGFAPHIRLEYAPDGLGRASIPDWRETTKFLAGQPHVKSVAPFIQDYVFMDVDGRHNPGLFRAVDTEDPDQVAGLEKLLDLKNYPGGSGDLGLEKKVVISSHVAKGFDVKVGDKIKLYSTRNIQEVQRPYDVVNFPPVRERYQEQIATAREILGGKLEHRGNQVFIPQAQFEKLVDFSTLFADQRDSIRDEEQNLLIDFFSALSPAAEPDDGKLLEGEGPAQALEALKKLDATDRDQMDLKTLKGVRELILPQEVTVAGVFNPGQMAVMPEVFMPMNLAQQLSGLEDSVLAISVRIDNSYDAEPVASALKKELPPGWVSSTWWAEFGDFAKLIAQQRIMMYIVMSMIIVISAFSMMAVMFTVTLQKRREIGVMKALGAAPGQIVWVFLHQGVILGIVGAIAGSALALVTLPAIGQVQNLMRQWFGFDPFSEAFNGFSSLPYQVIPLHVVIVIVCAFLLCCLAAMVPAMRAASSDAAKSLRNL